MFIFCARGLLFYSYNQGWEFTHLLIPHLLISLISLISLKSNENCERFAQMAQDKWATMSKLLRLLRGNERQWAIRSGHTEEMSEWAIRPKMLAKNLKSCF